MPRNYKPSKLNKKLSPEVLRNAIADIDDGLSLRNTAKKYDIHYSVLYRHHKNRDQVKKRGGQAVLTEEEEKSVVSRLIICADWGYHVDSWLLRILVKDLLDRQDRKIEKFKDNMPGRDFVYSFLKRHKSELSSSLYQNLKKVRSSITPDTIIEYFYKLKSELEDALPSHGINYDDLDRILVKASP